MPLLLTENWNSAQLAPKLTETLVVDDMDGLPRSVAVTATTVLFTVSAA